jgi:hypothetical protein
MGIRWPGDGLGEQLTILPAHVEACRVFLSRCKPTKTAGIGSYGLKHLIEKVTGYVSNGACIRAALDLGLKVIPAHRGYGIIEGRFFCSKPLNAWIYVSRRSVRTAMRLLGGAR